MKILPWEHIFDIRTGLAREAAEKRMKNEISEGRIAASLGNRRFRGEVNDRGFDIREAVHHIWGLLPVFHGRFERDKGSVLVRVRATNGASVFGVLFSWSTAIVMFYQAFYCGFIEKRGLADATPFLIQGAAYVGLGVFFSSFYWHKVKKGKIFLNEVFRDKGLKGKHSSVAGNHHRPAGP